MQAFKFEDNKGVTRSQKWKEKQKKKKKKNHRKYTIQKMRDWTTGIQSGAQEEQEVPAPLVAPIVLLNILW